MRAVFFRQLIGDTKVAHLVRVQQDLPVDRNSGHRQLDNPGAPVGNLAISNALSDKIADLESMLERLIMLSFF